MYATCMIIMEIKSNNLGNWKYSTKIRMLIYDPTYWDNISAVGWFHACVLTSLAQIETKRWVRFHCRIGMDLLEVAS
jgi:hypothetical protein